MKLTTKELTAHGLTPPKWAVLANGAVRPPKLGHCYVCGGVIEARWRSPAGLEVLVTGREVRVWTNVLATVEPPLVPGRVVGLPAYYGQDLLLRTDPTLVPCRCGCYHTWREFKNRRSGGRVTLQCINCRTTTNYEGSKKAA